MTSYVEIKEWFQRGVEEGDAYMAVWCDTFDWSDYPAYYFDKASAQAAIDNPGSMQKVMEVYDLRQACTPQMNQHRCWALRPLTHRKPV